MRHYFQIVQRYLPHIFFLTLLLWGAYATLYYIGVDAHIVVLLKDPQWQKIAKEVNGPVMRGFHGMAPFLELTFERLMPFAGYAIACFLLYGIAIAYTVLRHGRMFFDFHFTPFRVFLLGVCSLWLIFTTLFYAPLPGIEPGLILEPSAEVYHDISQKTLVALEENFQRLQEENCLKRDPTRKGPREARVFIYKGICVQKAFFTRALSQLSLLSMFVLEFLVLGSAILWLIRLRPATRLTEFIMSLALGAAVFISFLWLLALFKSLHSVTAWSLVAIIPVAGHRYVLQWVKIFLFEKWRITEPFHSAAILIFWLLVSYLAFNFLTVLRPFPIGWDDLGRYINVARQLSVFGQITPQIPAMQWEYLTSLGFVLFGYFSTFGATLAQQINWLAGPFAILAVYTATKIVLGPRTGLLAALFYYTLPMVGHFSFADMKTENALFFFVVVGLIAVLLYAHAALGLEQEGICKERNHWQWLFIAGILCAAGFATKPTMILMFFLVGTLLTFVLLGRTGGWGAVLLSLAVLILMGPLSPKDIMIKISGAEYEGLNNQVSILLVIIGVALLFAPFFFSLRWPVIRLKNPPSWSLLRSYWFAVSVFVGGFILFSSPWIGNNMYLHKTWFPTVGLKMPNHITPLVLYELPKSPRVKIPPGSRELPEGLKIDTSHERCKSTAGIEEQDRYWGYGSGVGHYAGLPWRIVMNTDSQGYYITTSFLPLLIIILLLAPLFWRNTLLRLIFWGTLLYLAEWIFVASGIPWYGIGMFLGIAVSTEALVACAPNKPSKILMGTFVGLALCMMFSLRMWQFGMQQNLYEYAWGKASHEVLREMTIPDYGPIADKVVELSKNPERPYLYRMGTFISYFVPRNLEIIVRNDNQLDFFSCLNQEGDHQLTLKRLYALGIHSIVFDTNTATIEKDNKGTLHQKVGRFLDFANDPEVGMIPFINNPNAGVAYMILPEPKIDDLSEREENRAF